MKLEFEWKGNLLECKWYNWNDDIKCRPLVVSYGNGNWKARWTKSQYIVPIKQQCQIMLFMEFLKKGNLFEQAS